MSIKPFYADPDVILAHYTLAPSVQAFSTTRAGGVSRGSYAAMNINPYCGDSAEAIVENRRRLAQALGITPENIILPHQVHGTETRLIDDNFLHLSATDRHNRLEGVDALITKMPGVCIGVSTADCVPVLLYDTIHHASAAIHAGWRGTQQRIVGYTLQKMAQTFGSKPSDVHAVIGPCISLHAFEVGQEVYDQFLKAGFDMPRIARREEKWHLNLPLCNRLQLQEWGVPAHQITDSNSCTFTQSEQYFSARRLGIHSGRIYSGIMLNAE